MRRLMAVVVLVLAWPGTAHARVPIAHAAATCADYQTQAAAQQAADTRDADGDGVYCEDLPCPCLGAETPTGSDQSAATEPRLGRSITFGKVTRREGCQGHDGLPDRRCTPGSYYAAATTSRICQPGYSSQVRNVSESTKNAIYRAYGVRHHTRATYEIDHLVPLELGGSNIKANLFAEAGTPKPGFHEKDRLENELHRRVCEGTMRLRHAQRMFATNWVRAYRRYDAGGA